MKATDVKTEDVMSWAIAEIQKHKIKVPNYPDADVELDELGTYMHEFSSMYRWGTTLLGLTEAELQAIEAEFNLLVDRKKPFVEVKSNIRNGCSC